MVWVVDHVPQFSYRHRFYNPEFAEIRRQTTYEKVKDYEPAWRFFMEYAQQLHLKHSRAYTDLEIKDIILGK